MIVVVRGVFDACDGLVAVVAVVAVMMIVVVVVVRRLTARFFAWLL